MLGEVENYPPEQSRSRWWSWSSHPLGGGYPPNERKCDAKNKVKDRKKTDFSFSMLCPHDVSRESGGAWDTGNDSVSRFWWPKGRHEGRVDAK